MGWLKNVWRRRSQEQELDKELRFHIDRQIDDYVKEGLSRDQARRRVQLEFGGLELTKDECRDVRPLRWLDDLEARRARLGFRGLARDRLLAISVTAILGVGIATSVTMFSVLNAVVLRPLAYARPGRTGHHQHAPDCAEPLGRDVDGQSGRLARPEQDLHLDDVLPAHGGHASQRSAGVDAPQRAQEGLVGPEFFDLLGTPAPVGRTFSRDEFDRKDRVVVLSESLWRERFGGPRSRARPEVPTVAGEEYLIIGVMPRTFQLPSRETRLWRPLSVLPLWPGDVVRSRQRSIRKSIRRLAPGVQFEEAAAEMPCDWRSGCGGAHGGQFECRHPDRSARRSRGSVSARAAVCGLASPRCSHSWESRAPTSAACCRRAPRAGGASWRYGWCSVPAAHGSSGSFWRRASVSGRSRARWVCFSCTS